MIEGVLRVLGALLLAGGLLVAIWLAMLAVIYAVLLVFRYVPLTGRHRNKDLDVSNRPR